MYGYEGMVVLRSGFDRVRSGADAGPEKRRFFGPAGTWAREYQIYDPYSIAPAAGGLFSRAAAAQQHHPGEPDRSAGRKNCPALRSAEPARHCRRHQQLHQRQKLPRQFLQPHRSASTTTFRKQRFFVRADATRNHRVQDQRHSDTVGHILYRTIAAARSTTSTPYRPTFFVNVPLQLTRATSNGKIPDQMGWDLAGLGFSSDLRQRDQGASIPACCAFRRSSANNGLTTGSPSSWRLLVLSIRPEPRTGTPAMITISA